MLNRRLIGSALTPFDVAVERWPLRAFSKATGQDDPVYWDVTAARAAGYPDLLVPPTFLFCLEMSGPDPTEVYERLGVDYAHVLHGEQHFTYHRLVFAGESLYFSAGITDLYEKKAGALSFIVWVTRVTDAKGAEVADLRSVMVVRNPSRASDTRIKRKAPEWGAVEAWRSEDGPITRHRLGLYAGASGDYNPLHIDVDFAKRAGMSDVFAHGMLSGAYAAKLLTNSFGQSAIRSLSLRFVSMTHIGDEVHCVARADAAGAQGSSFGATVELMVRNQHDELKLTGVANIDPNLGQVSQI